MKTVDGLLRAREAQGLTWSLTARLTVIATAAFLAISSLVPLRKDIVAGLCLAGACLTLYGLRLVRRQEHLHFVGLSGVLYDLAFLVTAPILYQGTRFVVIRAYVLSGRDDRVAASRSVALSLPARV